MSKGLCALVVAVVLLLAPSVTVKPVKAQQGSNIERQVRALESIAKSQEKMVRLMERQTRALEGIAKAVRR